MIDGACDWTNPGASPYRGSAFAAIAQMPIPERVQGYLIARARQNAYDDVVTIRRDSIEGTYDYSTAIRYMVFAKGKVCAIVTRNHWPAERTERAMVFCEEGWCVARPSVCNNWFLITRLGKLPPLTSFPPSLETGPPIAPLIPPVTFEREPEKPSFAAPPEIFAGPPDTFVEYHDAPPSSWQAFSPIYGIGPFLDPNATHIGFVPDLPPIAPIPELPAWMYFVTGIGFLALLLRGWRRRP